MNKTLLNILNPFSCEYTNSNQRTCQNSWGIAIVIGGVAAVALGILAGTLQQYVLGASLVGIGIYTIGRGIVQLRENTVRKEFKDSSVSKKSTDKNSQIVNKEPKFLFRGIKIQHNEELNFAHVNVSGVEKLVPVIYKPSSKECTLYPESPLEAILKIAQNKEYKLNEEKINRAPIRYLLGHPKNAIISEEEFFKFILAKDPSGTPRIFTLNSASTLEILTIIKEKNIPLNLNEKSPKGETLFTLWAGTRKFEITKLILEIDPSVIEQTRKAKNSAFIAAALKGSREGADIILKAMEGKNIPLSDEEICFKKAFINDLDFTKDEISNLAQTKKYQIFWVAKRYGNQDFADKLFSMLDVENSTEYKFCLMMRKKDAYVEEYYFSGDEEDIEEREKRNLEASQARLDHPFIFSPNDDGSRFVAFGS